MEILDEKLYINDRESIFVRYRWISYILYYLLCSGSLYLGDFINTNRVEPFRFIFGEMGIPMITMSSGLIFMSVKLLSKSWSLRYLLFIPLFGTGLFAVNQIEDFRGMSGVDEFALEMFFYTATIVILMELLRLIDRLWLFIRKKNL